MIIKSNPMKDNWLYKFYIEEKKKQEQKKGKQKFD